MDHLDMAKILPKLADIEQGIDEYLTLGEINTLQRCVNDNAYDEIWPMRFDVSSKYDIWDILRLEKSAQENKLRPYRQADFRCCRKTPAVHAPCISLLYAYKGSVECELPDRYLELKEHQLCVVNSGTLINFSSTDPEGYFLSLFFNKLYLNNVMIHRFPSDSLFTPFFEQALFGAQHGMDYLIFDIEDSARARDYYMTAAETFLAKPNCHQEIESSLIFLIFCELMKIWENQHIPERPLKTELSAYEIINYISANYKTVTLSSISEHFHFHPDHMRKTIKSLMNKNFLDIVQDVRLTSACQLLRETDMPVSEIVVEIGYQNVSHFYTLFKKRYQCSPADYRAAKRLKRGPATDNENTQNG